jgi:3-oxoisoapionate decarboxylase
MPMSLSRRKMLLASAPAIASLSAALAAEVPGRPRMGVVIHSYGLRRAADPAAKDQPRFDDPLTFLEYCRALGAGGVQLAIGVRDETYAAKLRRQLDDHKLYLEGSIRLPRDKDDVARFTAEVAGARACGALVLRTTLMDGRRYEVFDSAEAFRRFQEQSWQALLLARPVVEKHEVKLAVENHKDLRAGELADVLKRLDSRQVGACVDTGNNIALLEDPLEVVQTLAPYAVSSHIKDMGVEEYPDGFLLAEVPFGTGFLDLAKIIETLRRARPEIRFNLEMITRDPLRVPCLGKKYWVTFADLPARHLASTLALVRANAAKKPLPRVSGLSTEEKVKLEDDNVRRCLSHAREHLGL